MKARVRIALVAAVGISVATCLSVGTSFGASDGAEWGYSGAEGPANWGSLDPSYATCSSGKKQSPINIKKTTAATLSKPTFSYGVGKGNLVDTGHTVDVFPANEGVVNSVSLDGKDYSLVQFHFHTPSEHTVNGKHFPLEVHFVNKAADGELAVFGVLVKEGAPANSAWSKVASNLDKARTDGESKTALPFNWGKLLPIDQSTYRYSGSLTTPPCTEGVKFNIFSKPITMSAKQIEAFEKAYDGNNRPVQPLNGRVVSRVTAGR